MSATCPLAPTQIESHAIQDHHYEPASGATHGGLFRY